MLRTIVIVLFVSQSTFGWYQKKTRFDRSLVSEEELDSHENKDAGPSIYIDDTMRYIAYKDTWERTCYLEKMRNGKWNSILTGKFRAKMLYPSNLPLTNVEAWKLAGGRIVSFCEGNSIKLLQDIRPISADAQDPFLNEIPHDENDVIEKRVADVVLTPLLSRAKRQIMLEKREQLNQQFARVARQTYHHGGKFRGQTQSQYLNHGGDGTKEGKAEAEATDQSSRALVSGTNGMGQAQSMSSGGSGCEDCINYLGSPGSRDGNAQSLTGVSHYPSVSIPGRSESFPNGVISPTSGSAIPTGYPVPAIQSGPKFYPGGVFPPTSDSTNVPSSYSNEGMPGGSSAGPYSGSATPQGSGVIIPGYPGTTGPASSIGSRPYSDSTVPSNGAAITTGRFPSEFGSYPSGIIPSTGGTGIPQGRSGVTVPGGAGSYPNGIISPTDGTAIQGRYPSGTIPGGSGSYPSGIIPPTGGTGIPQGRSGVTVPGGAGSYPSGIIPPTGGTGIQGRYPSGTIPGGSGSYPSGIISPNGGNTVSGVYPSTGSDGSSGAHHSDIIPPVPGNFGSQTSGFTPSIGGTSISEGYPGTVPSGSGSYSNNFVPSTSNHGIPGFQSNGVAPSGNQPTLPITYREGVSTSGVPGSYSAGVQQPGTTITGNIPNMLFPVGGQQPGPTIPSTIPGAPLSHPINAQQPGSMMPSNIPGISGSYPSGAQQPGVSIPGQASYPTSGSTIQGYYPTSGQQSGAVASNGITGMPGTYSTGAQQPGIPIPGQQQYPTGGTNIPGSYPISSHQPNTGITSGVAGIPGTYSGTPGSLGSSQGVATPSVYSGIYPGYPTPGTIYAPGQASSTSYLPFPSSIASGVTDDGSDSHASSSVKQTDDGTQASATADGKFGTGTAQSQVSGVYSGSGSFNAQAGTNDGNKGAQTQISGGKEGAMSNAQGMGGQGKSQAQVQLNSDTGATTTGAQSTGWNHGTNSQVQASAKGGMADAQANGEGNTSSQAQIGFQPYMGSKEKEKDRAKPFRGGGQASAQSGTYRGQSQSQIDGSFQYGITYTGAAQAGSGSGAGASRKPFNFSIPESNLFKSFEKFDPITIKKNDETSTESELNNSSSEKPNLKTGSSSRKTVIVRPQKEQEESIESSRNDPRYDSEIEEYDAEYETDDYSGLSSSQMSGDTIKVRSGGETSRQIQTINIGNDKKYNVHVIQDNSRPRTGDILQPGHSLPGYTIPSGFRGRVSSISGDRTQAHGNGKSQAQTVSLIPSDQGRIQVGKSAKSETKSLKSAHERESNAHGDTSRNHNSPPRTMNGSSTRSLDASPVKSNYFTVTKSVTGKLGDPRQKYEHRYYTKSSTCGYFTFSCNIVHGSNGRTKICKPKMPTYPDGTPMKC